MSPTLAAGGFFIVKKNQRQQGIGKMLWDARLRYLGDVNIGIDAVESRIEPNKVKGFIHATFEMATFIGPVKKELIYTDTNPSANVSKYDPETDLTALIQYDAKHHQVERAVFLKHFLRPMVTSTFVARRGAEIVGYGSIQPVEMDMYHIGPVFAEEDQIGCSLINHLLSLVPHDKQVTWDAPLENKTAMDIIEKHNLRLDLKCLRMYNKAPVKLDLQRIYCITTLGVSVI